MLCRYFKKYWSLARDTPDKLDIMTFALYGFLMLIIITPILEFNRSYS